MTPGVKRLTDVIPFREMMRRADSKTSGSLTSTLSAYAEK